jgi:hypothetical protein
MPVQFSKGITYAANENITNTKLHTLVDNGSLLPGAISEQPVQSASLVTADSLLFLDASIPALTQLQLAKLWAEPMQIGQTNKVTADFAVVSAPVAQFTSASIANLTGVSSISGPAPNMVKAFAQFFQPAALTSTAFTFVGTTITATKTSHGLAVNDSITISGQTGNNTVLNGTWKVQTVPSANIFTFVITSTPAGALAAATVNPIPIRSAFNVDSVTFNASGDFTVNFAAGVLSSSNYVVLATAQQRDASTLCEAVGIKVPNTTPYTTPSLQTSSQVTLTVQGADGTKRGGICNIGVFST